MASPTRKSESERRAIWSFRLTQLIAKQIKHLRESPSPKIINKELETRTEQLGLKISRETIAALETGRRDSVSVAEWLVLAAALDVPPMALLVPENGEVEILPGVQVSPSQALAWLVDPLVESPAAKRPSNTHRGAVVEMLRDLDRHRRFLDLVMSPAATADHWGSLRLIRHRMRERGQDLPSMPRELIEREQADAIDDSAWLTDDSANSQQKRLIRSHSDPPPDREERSDG